MFVLVVIEDKIKIKPDQFDRDIVEAVEEQIELKYCDRIILDAGLCVAFYDFVEMGDPLIYPAEGSAHLKVKFRLVVFRPFPEEIIVGKVVESTSTGLKISLGFFQDILIPIQNMQIPSHYDPVSKSWIWKYEVDNEWIDFVICVENEIRCRVKSINFTATKSTIKGIEVSTSTESILPQNQLGKVSGEKGIIEGDVKIPILRRRSSSVGVSSDELTSPMEIIASISEEGLGPISWW